MKIFMQSAFQNSLLWLLDQLFELPMQFQIYFVSIKNFSIFTIQVNLNRIETSLNNKVIDMSKSTMYQQIGEGKKRRTQP
jgi:hypothetical protein